MKVSIIIVSYNTQELLYQTLKSLPWSKDHEVIVVDNASADTTVAMVNEAFPAARIIQNHQNEGFARANNEGMKVARGEYFFLLNSDAQVTGKALDRLVHFLDTHPRVAAVTPKVTLPDGSIDIACHRGLPTPWNAFTYFSQLETLFPRFKPFGGYHQTYKGFDTPHAIDATAATALLVRKKALDEIGLFDERFFLYGEDLDLCKRLTDAGWSLYYLPDALALHLKSASGKQHTSPKTRQAAVSHFYDTMKQFYEKHYVDTYPRWLRQLVYWGIDLKKMLHP